MRGRDYQDLSGIELVLDSDELLRKKWRGLTAAQEAFREAAIEQMRSLDRRPFPPSVEVAVQLDLHHPHTHNQPHAPGVVKAYLDALEGVAYENDRQVSCLTVHRRAVDHPMMKGVRATSDRASIFAGVLPLARYTELYDRAVRSMWTSRKYSPWWPRWSVGDEAELINLRRKLVAAGDRADEPLRDHVRLLEEARLRDGTLVDIDRPGPFPPGANAIHRILRLPRVHLWMRQRHGAILLLGLRGLGPGTDMAVRLSSG